MSNLSKLLKLANHISNKLAVHYMHYMDPKGPARIDYSAPTTTIQDLEGRAGDEWTIPDVLVDSCQNLDLQDDEVWREFENTWNQYTRNSDIKDYSYLTSILNGTASEVVVVKYTYAIEKVFGKSHSVEFIERTVPTKYWHLFEKSYQDMLPKLSPEGEYFKQQFKDPSSAYELHSPYNDPYLNISSLPGYPEYKRPEQQPGESEKEFYRRDYEYGERVAEEARKFHEQFDNPTIQASYVSQISKLADKFAKFAR